MILFNAKAKRYHFRCDGCGALFAFFDTTTEMEEKIETVKELRDILTQYSEEGNPKSFDKHFCPSCSKSVMEESEVGDTITLDIVTHAYRNIGIDPGDVLVCIRSNRGQLRYLKFGKYVIDLKKRTYISMGYTKGSQLAQAVVQHQIKGSGT